MPIIVTKKIVHDKLYLTTFRKKMSAVWCDYCHLFTIRASSFTEPLAKMRRGATEEEGNWFLKLLFEDSRPEKRSAVLTEFGWQFLCCNMAANIITQRFNTYLGQCMDYIHKIFCNFISQKSLYRILINPKQHTVQSESPLAATPTHPVTLRHART